MDFYFKLESIFQYLFASNSYWSNKFDEFVPFITFQQYNNNVSEWFI